MLTKKTKTFMIIGDWKDFDTYRKLLKQRRSFYGTKFNFQKCSYWDILSDSAPKINTKEVIIFTAFPYEYWDKYIEPKDYKKVYGNNEFYTKFEKFWKDIKKKLSIIYKDKKIVYINNLDKLTIDRDKLKTKQLVKKEKVDVPKTHTTRDVPQILKLINKGNSLFAKVRFGSMGKGITLLEKNNIKTNFRYRNGKILSRKSDYGWSFITIKDKNGFLKALLKEDVIIEDAIDPLIIENRKFDIRFYVYKNKILYTYCRTNTIDSVTTNISQGATGEKTSYIQKIPKKQLDLAKKYAIKSIKALGLNFGGVDIMLTSNGKAKFIEVNTFPGLPRARRFNLSKRLYENIIKDY